MDDVLVLAPTRWKLRRAVKVVNQVLSSTILRLVKHPDKTFIGRIDKCFEFLGYHIRQGRLSVASKTFKRFLDRARRLDEQEPRATAAARLGVVVRRWVRWVHVGLDTALGLPQVDSVVGTVMPSKSRVLTHFLSVTPSNADAVLEMLH